MQEGKNLISVSEDKIKLAMVELNKYKNEKTKFVSYLTIMLSFLIPVFTAEFKTVAFLDAKFIYGVFITLTLVFFVLSVIAGLRVLIYKKRGIGSDEWFLCVIKGVTYKKEKKNFRLSDFDFKLVLYYIFQVIYWLLPIAFIVFIYSMIGWGVVWNRSIPQNGDLPTWVPTLFLSIIGLFGMYAGLYWLYDNFFSDLLEDKLL